LTNGFHFANEGKIILFLMDWLQAAKTGAKFPNQTAKHQEIDFKLKQDKHRKNTCAWNRNYYYCEYHCSNDWPCWDCEVEYMTNEWDAIE